MTEHYWAVVPAAGIGRRMNSDKPKQYLTLRDRCVIEHTIERLASVTQLQGIVIVLAAEDTRWSELAISREPRVSTAVGGKERCHSVLAGLNALEVASGDDWILVHDAARPCIRKRDIERLIERLMGHPVGGVLGAPVRDTLKRCNDLQEITATVDRSELWHAFTPQMFRFQLLREALENSIDAGELVTDEAQAVERHGHVPMIVEGSSDNIKITHPSDLVYAEQFMNIQTAAGDP